MKIKNLFRDDDSLGGGNRIALVGGSGFNEYPGLNITRVVESETPYGLSAPISFGEVIRDSGKGQSSEQESADRTDRTVIFMPRHGSNHRTPPHLINYRANIWALKNCGVKNIIAMNAVGGINEDMGPGTIIFPHQIIDYTHGREHTYFTGGESGVEHADFTDPFTEDWRKKLIEIGRGTGLNIKESGVYACTQGPRLETAAEINRLRNEGCDLVGMTVMPEAALARELDLHYASISIVVNWAAGLSPEPITIDAIYQQLEASKEDLIKLLSAILP